MALIFPNIIRIFPISHLIILDNLQCKATGTEKWYNAGVLNMCMMDQIRAKRDEIYAIARRHKAEKLWVFGSCARGEERPDSDVDFLVRFGDDTSLSDQGALRMNLSAILGRDVDVVDDDALLREPYFAYTARKDMVPL